MLIRAQHETGQPQGKAAAVGNRRRWGAATRVAPGCILGAITSVCAFWGPVGISPSAGAARLTLDVLGA